MSIKKTEHSDFAPTESSFQQGQQLARALIRAELTPSEIRATPAQQLYVAILCAGWELLPDVIPFVGQSQYQLLMDFDFWEKDSFSTERFMRWLSMIQADDSFELLHQFLEAIPSEVLELATQNYVEVLVFDEKTETPPSEGWFTPDQGQLWLRFRTDDEYEQRLLGKLYAYLFQASPEMFYQLMLNLNVSTSIELEESGVEARQRRIVEAGMPDLETQFELQTPLPLGRAIRILQSAPSSTVLAQDDLPAISTNQGKLEPYSSFVKALSEDADVFVGDQAVAELATILNSGLLLYSSSIEDELELERLQRQVRGIINLALEALAQEQQFSPKSIYEALHLRGLYRLGLWLLGDLRSVLLASDAIFDDEDGQFDAVKRALQSPIPEFPVGWCETTSFEEGRFSEVKPFEHIKEVSMTTTKLLERMRDAGLVGSE